MAGYADVHQLWSLSGELADVAGCPVDLLDLRAASTVMQYQVITQGVRWWARDAQAAIFESAVLVIRLSWMLHGLACWRTFNSVGACMVDDVLINKAATIERCVQRARESISVTPPVCHQFQPPGRRNFEHPTRL